MTELIKEKMTEYQMEVIKKFEQKDKPSLPLTHYTDKLENLLVDMELAMKASHQFPCKSSTGGKVVSWVRSRCDDIANSLYMEARGVLIDISANFEEDIYLKVVDKFDSDHDNLITTTRTWWEGTKWDKWYHEDTKIGKKEQDHADAIKMNKAFDKSKEVKNILDNLSEEQVQTLLSHGLKL